MSRRPCGVVYSSWWGGFSPNFCMRVSQRGIQTLVDFHWIMIESSLPGSGNPTSPIMFYLSKNFILEPNTDFSSLRYDMQTSTDSCQVTHWYLLARTSPLTSPAGCIFFSPIGGFPPFSRQFLTPLRSGQIWGENRPIYRGVCLYK